MNKQFPRKLRVMRVIKNLQVAGAQKGLLLQLANMDRERYDLSVCCLRDKGPLAQEVEELGIPLYFLPCRTKTDPKGVYQLAKVMRDLRIDIVHTHLTFAATTGRIAALLARVPIIIVHLHNVKTWSPKKILIERAMTLFTDKIVTVSRAVRDDYYQRIGFSKEKMTIIYNGVDLENFQGSWNSEAKRKELGIPKGEKAVGIVAKLSPRKAQDLFLKAARLVTVSEPGVKFFIIGEGMEDAYEAQLRAMAQENGLRGKVIFTGLRRDIPQMLNALDVVVLCSHKEGFGRAALEAMACGKPLIVTAVDGMPEIIQDGINGLLIPPDGEEALARAILHLILDPELCQSLGHNAREHSANFSIQSMVKQIQDLYEELAQRKAKKLMNR